MITLNIKNKNSISFVGLKNILTQLNLFEKENSKNFKKSCKILNINFDEELNFSLTTLANIQHQIRFYTKNKVKRELIKIIRYILKYNELITIKVNNIFLLDNGTKLFFKLFKLLYPNKIQIIVEEINAIENIKFSDNEKLINEIINYKILNKDNIELLYSEVEKYLNIGDFYTSIEILNFIENYDSSSKLYKLFSIAYNMEENSIKTEYYLKKWYEYSSLEDKASCLYSMAMFFSRHIENFKRNEYKGLKYINEGYEILKTINKFTTFHKINKIFNRNGFAFFLFKQGKYNEAIDLEKQLINEIDSLENKKTLLQKTVLLFNLGQCYVASNDFDNAIKTYNDLIKLDFNFAEYHIELAKIYISVNNFKSALYELEIAKTLDEVIPEIYSLIGYINYTENNYDNALKNYKEAFLLTRSADTAYDYLFILTELNQYSEALKIIENFNYSLILDNVDIVSIISEIYYNMNNKEKAITTIELGIKKFNNENLIKNLEDIKNAI